MSALPRAENVHSIFRGSIEAVKYCRLMAFLLDTTAAGITIYGLTTSSPPGWRPFAVLILALAGVSLRRFSDHGRSHAQWCRRKSIRALAFGRDIDPGTESTARSDALPFSQWLGGFLPAKNLVDYYEPTLPVGDARLRELYAHSAFYTWRLQRMYASVSWFFVFSLLCVTVAVFYGLVLDNPPPNVRDIVLEALCSTLFILFGIRSFEAAIVSTCSANESRKIADALVEKPLPDDQRLMDLADEYDHQRNGGIDAPTALYRAARDRLQREWSLRKDALT